MAYHFSEANGSGNRGWNEVLDGGGHRLLCSFCDFRVFLNPANHLLTECTIHFGLLANELVDVCRASDEVHVLNGNVRDVAGYGVISADDAIEVTRSELE